ncbi:MAG: hypothetical protein U0168_16300 [Nannocystaceae bacterium]
MTPRAIPLASVLLLLVACKKEGPTDLPICLSEVAGDEAVEASSGQLPPEIWFQVLLKSYNRKTGIAPAPVKDCSGKLVEPALPPETAACIAGPNAGAPLPERPLVPDDLVIVPTDDGRSLVWVKAKHFDDGDALGPIAIAEWTKRGIAVRSIGAMRAHANRAKLRLEPMGSGKVLVIESDECAKDNPKQCERIMRLVPMIGDRFDERAVLLADGSCVGPAEFSLYSKREVSQGGNLRSFELTRTVSFTDGNVMMSEAVVIKDRDPSKPDEPAKVFRNASVQRPLTLTERAIQTTPGVWEPMLAEHGSVSAPRASE